MTTIDVLHHGVRAGCSEAMARWFTGALEAAASGSEAQLLSVYTDASRRLPDRPLALDAALSEASTETAGVPFDQWTIVDAARACLLLTRAEGSAPAAFVAAATACYEQGDAGEQRSWLRAAALLPSPDQFLLVAIDACRTNIVPNFEAVACENLYPSRYFPERNFNQLVLKALFNNIRLARIVGLAARANADLARMANDYAAERRAAGRTVPADIGLALTGAPHGAAHSAAHRAAHSASRSAPQEGTTV